ncbi:alpha/beta hydrolase [Aerococcaceae bacterium NML180378]|nr:alpha/beta hydrolase [Aerococcaceae bacterium NML180378]
MKVIFVHGLGQSADAWQAVIAALPEYDCLSVNCFEAIDTEQVTQEILTLPLQTFLEKQHEPFVLVGLSLGSVLALSLKFDRLPFLKGLVLASAQYQLKNSLLFKLQYGIFCLLPQKIFTFGLSKAQTLSLLNSQRNLDLSENVATIHVPVHLICGAKDYFNKRASLSLHDLLPHSTYVEVPEGKHELNSQKPLEFAQEVRKFVTSLPF